MVSNTLKISQDDLLKTVTRLKKKYAHTAGYQRLRKDLPEEWPL
jgi:hypothetical protein